ncbi:MAG TPA: baseplate J/gp47 family protein [Candidatus Kapabacteria bacterium]|nr:baseplate J/gp47 family protein [Candidatus Kapabacteria bacterium]
MITKLTSVEELKQILTEILFNKTTKVTKVSSDSVLNGIFYGNAKIAQKCIKDIALVESHLFPDYAFDTYLDTVAENNGISPRFAASQSSTYIRIVATPGTTYSVGTHTFSTNSGINFNLEQNITIGTIGYAYAKVRSTDTGESMNTDALTISRVSPIPSGHKYVINEYKATGGRDLETDDLFRKRIKEGSNILAKDTISMIEQVFMKINSNVLRVIRQRNNDQGKVVLGILTQNGIDLTTAELATLLDYGHKYFSFTEYRPYSTNYYGIDLINVVYQPIDVSFRCELIPGYSVDAIRKDIQIKFSKKYDFKFWDSNLKIDWAELLQIVRTTAGVKYVPDNYFYPNMDISIDADKFPRFRGFLLLDLSGNIVNSITNPLNPLFYPAVADFSYQQTTLMSI